METLGDGPIRKSERPTIMSGKVVTLATGFIQEDGVFGPIEKACGPFAVSISRDAVMVHHANCESPEEVDQLILALQLAKGQFERLKGHSNGY